MANLTSAVTAAGASIANSAALQAAVATVLAGGETPTLDSRTASPFELARTIREIQRHGEDFTADLGKRGQRPDPVDSVLRALRLASTYRQKTQFDDPEAMSGLRRTIEGAIAARRPLVLTLPLGGSKIPNPLKTGTAFLPDVGEWLAWTRLAAMARAITKVSGLPARVLIVPDAPLHTADLGIPAVEASAHLRLAQQDLETLGIADTVTIADTAAHLPTGWSEEVAARAAAAAARADRDPEFAANVAAQARSLLFATNLRLYPWSPERQLLVVRALTDPSGLPQDVVADAGALRAEVERKVFHYIGVNHALRSMAIPELLVAKAFGEDHVMMRLTVHAKPGEPQPLLVQASAMARPGLLPMHGIGLRFTNDHGETRFANGFALEAAMAGMRSVIDGAQRPLWVEPGPVADEMPQSQSGQDEAIAA